MHVTDAPQSGKGVLKTAAAEAKGLRVNSLALLRLGSIFVPVVASLVFAAWSYQSIMRDAEATARSQARLVSEYALRLVDTQMTMLKAVELQLALGLVEGVTDVELHQFLAALDGTQSASHGIAAISLEGRMVASSANFPVDVDVGERSYLKAARAGVDPYIDRIVLQPGREDAFIVSRRVVTPQLDGLVISALTITAIREFLLEIAGDDGDAASIIRDDGQLLVRSSPTESLTLPNDHPGRTGMERGSSGTYTTRSVADGQMRLYAFTKVSGLPIVAHFGVSTEATITAWLRQLSLVALLLFALGAAGYSVVLGVERNIAARTLRLMAGSERQKRREAEALAELRRTMMLELNHRVKNNLHLITTMIGIQMREKGMVDPVELNARIHAISEVHDLLYRSGDGAHADFGVFLREVCANAAILPPEHRIDVDCQIDDGVAIQADRVTPIALAAVELITNAVKYAFKGRENPRLFIRLRRGSEEIELLIADNGPGMPAETTRSSGLRMVHAFVRQANGKLEQFNDGGAHFRLVLPSD